MFSLSINLEIFLHFNFITKDYLKKYCDIPRMIDLFPVISDIVYRFFKFLKPEENSENCQIVGKNDFREANHWWPLTDRKVDTVHDRYSRVSWDSACRFPPLVKIEDVDRSGFEYFEKWKMSSWFHYLFQKLVVNKKNFLCYFYNLSKYDFHIS